MCTYNGEKYIEEQLSSICNQTVLPNEIIISDDRSTDNTMKLIEKYKIKYSKINWLININDINLGFKKNFVNAAKKASGDILFFSDQDDIWNKYKIEKMMNIFKKKSDCLALTCSVTMFDGEKKIKDGNKRGIRKVNKISFHRQIRTMTCPGMALAVRSNIFALIIPSIEKRNLSHDTIVGLFAASQDGYYVLNESLVLYRIHSVNASSPIKNNIERFGRLERHVQGRVNRVTLYSTLIEDFSQHISKKDTVRLNKQIIEIKNSIVYLTNKNSKMLFKQIFSVNMISNKKISIFNFLMSLK